MYSRISLGVVDVVDQVVLLPVTKSQTIIHFALNCSRNSTNSVVFHLFEYFNKIEVSKNAK